jgi:hypothetical protein
MRWILAVKTWFSRRPSQAEKQLLHRCFGDAAQMQRLIDHEVARRPKLSRADAAKAALDRWARDR